MVERYSKGEKVYRWLLYGVALSVIPFLIAAFYDWYVGYDFNLFQIKYTPDFILITFAVAANACGYSTDKEKMSPQHLKKCGESFSIISLFCCTLFYAMLLGSKGNEDTTKNWLEEVAEGRVETLAIIAVIFLAVNILFGILLEAFENTSLTQKGEKDDGEDGKIKKDGKDGEEGGDAEDGKDDK